MRILRHIIITILLITPILTSAQSFIKEKNDTTTVTEYNDGRLWAYKQIGDIIVGMTNYEESDKYGKYYQIAIFVKNLGDSTITFNPGKIVASLYSKKGDTLGLKVYTYDKYMKKVKNAQAWSMALTGFSTGLNTGMAGYQTTYHTSFSPTGMPYTQIHSTYNHAAASAANMAATTQIMTLKDMMSEEKKTISQGYLKTNTIHPDEGILGYMNIKRKRGEAMTVYIMVSDDVFSFNWDVSKKTKK